MDPNETLRKIRDMVQRTAIMDSEHPQQELDEITDLFDELDQWLSKGGFLPDDWNAHSNVEARQRGMTS